MDQFSRWQPRFLISITQFLSEDVINQYVEIRTRDRHTAQISALLDIGLAALSELCLRLVFSGACVSGIAVNIP